MICLWQGLVKKALTTPRNGAKVQEVLVQMIESDSGAHVVPVLVAGMGNNSGKLAVAAAQTARQALQLLGPVPTQARECLVAACIGSFDSSAAAVRAEALALTRELLLALGPSIRPDFDSLREIQRKEVDDIMSSLPPTAANPNHRTPQRMLRSQAQRSTGSVAMQHDLDRNRVEMLTQVTSISPATDLGDKSAARQDSALDQEDPEKNADEDSQDVYECLAAEDVLGKLPAQWAAKVLSAPKWQDKKDMLDHLIALSSSPRLAAADYSEVQLEPSLLLPHKLRWQTDAH